MSLILILVAVPASLLLWRDLKSGRIYEPTGRFGQFDYDAEEPFADKVASPVYYWVVIGVVAVCCLGAFVMAILLLFIPEERLEIGQSKFPIAIIPLSVHGLYLIQGLGGRAVSWVKNYGSVDKKW